jgi:hypothetical protein
MDPNFSKEAVFKEIASSATTPASGKVYLYAKEDGQLYSKDDAGTEAKLRAFGGSTGTVDNAILRADGTAGDALKSSGLVVADAVTSITGITGDSSTNVITATGSGFTNGQPIQFTALTGGSGLDTFTNYFVREVSGDTFKVETSIGGGAVNFTTNITEGTLIVGNSPNTYVAVSQNTPETNSALVLTPKGNGAFILGPPPDATTLGGDRRGNYAVDLQVERSQSNQVANGNYCFVAGRNNRATQSDSIALGNGNLAMNGGFSVGDNNTSSFGSAAIGGGNSATGEYSLAAGLQCQSSENVSVSFGFRARSDRLGMFSHAIGFFEVAGDTQFAKFVLRIKTTNDTPTTLMINGNVRLTIPSGKVFSFIAQITGIKSDGSAVAKYIREGTIKNVGGTTSLVGSIITVGTDHEDSAGTDVAITADDTNDALDISVTGIAAETWRWTAVVQGVEIAYGT